MNIKMKWALIISGYVIVFILTFIFTGGLAALLDLIQEIKNVSEVFINQIIKLIQASGG